MASTDESLALLTELIVELRDMLGVDVIPHATRERVALDTIGLIRRQRRDLFQSGVKVALPRLTQNVCEAQTFSEDAEENWVLQYTYQKIAMKFFGEMRKQQVKRDREHALYVSAQLEQENGRESQS